MHFVWLNPRENNATSSGDFPSYFSNTTEESTPTIKQAECLIWMVRCCSAYLCLKVRVVDTQGTFVR